MSKRVVVRFWVLGDDKWQIGMLVVQNYFNSTELSRTNEYLNFRESFLSVLGLISAVVFLSSGSLIRYLSELASLDGQKRHDFHLILYAVFHAFLCST